MTKRKRHSFSAQVERCDPVDPCFQVWVPEPILAAVKRRNDTGKIPVKGTINGTPFRAFFMPEREPADDPFRIWGEPWEPRYYLYMYAPIIRALGEMYAGMTVRVEIEKDSRRDEDGKPLPPRAGPGALD